ncbi:unnamed protein product, partial [Rotaria sordida]
MSQVEQKLSSNRSSKKETKKLVRKVHNIPETMPVTLIENLSNEFFYEIFDYLHGIDIYNSFSNLNYRFQQLLNSSSLLFKIKVHTQSNESSMNIYKQIILLNKHQIFSIDLYIPLQNKHFFSLFSIDSSLDHLESLTLSQLDSNVLSSVIFNLSSLPRLFSLTINKFNSSKDLTDTYRIVLALPVLKYYKFSAENLDLSISFPISNNKQFSTIKYLVIDHFCTASQLHAILSYTPQLERLNYMDLVGNDINIGIILPITLSNLTHVSICTWVKTFDKFETFISKLYSKVNFLSIIILHEDITYLDANRWEKLILQYWPQLEKFYFQYYEYNGDDSEFPLYLAERNQFNSSFWIERKWVFKVDISYNDIIYSVCPYRQRWYEHDAQYKNINYSIEFLKYNQLTITLVPSDECFELFIISINRILSIGQIYYLEIPNKKIFIGILIQIIDLLPELNSLKIHSLSLSEPRDLCEDEVDICSSMEETSKITNVYLEKMIDITEVYFLMVLCPYMKHLKIGINNMNVELFVRNILNKINNECNDHLRLLCFHVQAA